MFFLIGIIFRAISTFCLVFAVGFFFIAMGNAQEQGITFIAAAAELGDPIFHAMLASPAALVFIRSFLRRII